MATTKLEKNQYPAGSSANDFQCFGPVATKDTEFDGFKMADMGCFQQEEKGKTKDGDARVIDSNKFYHCCICQHKKTKEWFLYVEFGRVGKSTTFQFTPCSSESDAMRAFVSQCSEKNTKRGEWATVAGIKMYVPKKDSKGQLKDLYSVQQLVSRDFGLPDAKNIAVDGGVPQKVAKTKTASKKSNRCDPQTTKLMADLLGGVVTYARTTIQGGTIPSQAALDDGRELLQSAKKRLVKIGSDDASEQVKDKDLKQITYALYSRIPKIKPIGATEETWILSGNNILGWEQDIDAFESALNATDFEDESDGADPMQGMPVDMEWINLKSDVGEYIASWWANASRNRHHGVGALTISNLWKVDRHGDEAKISSSIQRINKEMKSFNNERPLHQDKKRYDLSPEDRRVYWDTNTGLVFHGTRSVNVAGILRENFRLPKELVGVQINGANFGPGIYMADDWRKSAGYCSDSRSYWVGDGGVKGRKSFMFACDVVMGNPHVVSSGHAFTKPPTGHHSVFGKGGAGGYLQNNEWIVYEHGRARIRYLAELSWK